MLIHPNQSLSNVSQQDNNNNNIQGLTPQYDYHLPMISKNYTVGSHMIAD